MGLGCTSMELETVHQILTVGLIVTTAVLLAGLWILAGQD